MTVSQVLIRLHSLARPDQLEGMARFGIVGKGRLGVPIPHLRTLAREIGKDQQLALALWKTGIPEARILASMVGEPDRMTSRQMDAWVRDIDSWDICDQVCMNLFDKSPLAWRKVREWSRRDEEFVKRAAYALIACLAWHDRDSPDSRFLALLPLVRRGSVDGRNYVRKSVNWALRHIGKRNRRLHRAAIAEARAIRTIDSPAARWIGADALRELRSEAVQARLARRK
jgi:3-methyladenine DNA glycosylase AlkD